MPPLRILSLLYAAALMACGSSISTAPVASEKAGAVQAANDIRAADVSTTDTATAEDDGSFDPPAVVSSSPKLPFSVSFRPQFSADTWKMADVCYTVSGINRPLDATLCYAAQDYADLLARTHQQGHFADGDPEYRARRGGFAGSLRQPGKRLGNGETSYGIGEVLAFGHPNIDAAFQGWIDSPDHRSAVLEPTFDVCGFAKAKDANIWVGMFGNSKVAAAAPPVATTPMRTAPQVYSSCGPRGCGQQQYQRRGFFGRR